MIYLDTSALVKRYVWESGSNTGGPAGPSTSPAFHELTNTGQEELTILVMAGLIQSPAF